jgi:hypothetical protein
MPIQTNDLWQADVLVHLKDKGIKRLRLYISVIA